METSWQDILPWVTSANTLWAVWLNGHNVRLSWKVSLANQALWLIFIVAFGAWGLLPLTLLLAAVFARHLTRSPKPAPTAGRRVADVVRALADDGLRPLHKAHDRLVEVVEDPGDENQRTKALGEGTVAFPPIATDPTPTAARRGQGDAGTRYSCESAWWSAVPGGVKIVLMGQPVGDGTTSIRELHLCSGGSGSQPGR